MPRIGREFGCCRRQATGASPMTAGSEAEIRHALRAWVRRYATVEVPETFDDSTPLITSRFLTSLQISDLLLYVEELRGDRLNVGSLRPGVFRDIDAIYAAFFTDGRAGDAALAGDA